jgi:hypothetical protein
VKFLPDRCGILLRKVGPDGEAELLLDESEAAQLLGSQHPAVRDARLYSAEARRRRVAELETELRLLRQSLVP